MDLTQEYLRSILKFDAESGQFYWIKRSSRRVLAGHAAGTTNEEGYIIIRVKRKAYKAHRLAWLYVYGSWPASEIDHINRIPNDNRISNLREADRSINNRNRVMRRALSGATA